MSKRMIVPLLFGLIGMAILISLGVWQTQRLGWKQGVLAEIEARIHQAPSDLPVAPRELRDEYLAVRVSAQVLPGEIHVLVSRAETGVGFRLIMPIKIGERRVLLDRGFIRQVDKAADKGLPIGDFEGNLLWPDEIDPGYTPAPNLSTNTWFARDLPAMAAHLKTEPVLIVLNKPLAADDIARPWPVSVTGIPNNHLNYAITWFLLAVGWFGMTVYWLWRIRQQTD